jgi:hypothetical protein
MAAQFCLALLAVATPLPAAQGAESQRVWRPRGPATPLPAAQGAESQRVWRPRGAGSDLTVSLMTMGVGPRVWERFGHNAIIVEDRATGAAKAYNYGLFDFRQENFLLRFIQGRMWYWMQGIDLGWTIESYRRANRSIWVQELNLTPAQRAALRDFLEWNERPENRYYRYDYYRDNCSTRVRDAIDRVLGGRIRAATDGIETGTTYRSHTERLTADDLPLYTGLLVGLGEPADHPLTAWEEMFLPLQVRAWVRHVTVVDEAGREVPLVRSERTLFESSRPPPPTRPPHRVAGYLAVGLVLGGLLSALGSRAPRSRAARRGFAWMAGGWSLIAGLAGAVLAFLWAFTDHQVAYRNENLFQANLLVLPLLVLAPAAARGAGWARRPALALGLLIAAASLIGLAVKLFPWFSQQNGAVLALAVPANLGLALGLLRLGPRGPGKPA